MSSNASAGANAGPDVDDESPDPEFSGMLETLDVAIAEARRKVESGRVYDAENEKVRIKWIRALAYSVNVRRQVTADKTLEELSAEVEELREATDDA